MPTFKNGQFVEDSYLYVGVEDEIPDTGKITVALEKFLDCTEVLLARQDSWGVRLTVDSEPTQLVPWMDRISLVEVEFPKFSDGRGFSIAQLLRRRLGYHGELRGVGDVGLDQVGYLRRSGFDAFDLNNHDVQAVNHALGAFSNVYQPAADQSSPIFKKRLTRSTADAIH